MIATHAGGDRMENLELLDASALLRALDEGVGPSEVFVFRKRLQDKLVGSEVRVRLLNKAEEEQGLADAQKSAKARGELDGHDAIYKEEQALEVCSRALCHKEIEERDDGTKVIRPLFTSVGHMRKAFTDADMAQALNMYEVVKAKFGTVEEFDQATLDAWIRKLSDELLGAHFLSQLASSLWAPMLLHVCQLVAALQEEVGRPLPSLRDILASDPGNSHFTTGEFIGLPAASSANGVELPEDHYVDKSEAAAIAKQIDQGPPPAAKRTAAKRREKI